VFERFEQTLSAFEPEVLPALRDIHSKDPSVLEVDPLYLQGLLKDEGYLDYWPCLANIGAAIGAALDVLAIELWATLRGLKSGDGAGGLS
jgi:hypothetical protein